MFTRNPQNRNLNKQILSLAIPNIISNLSVPMLSAVDTALMGRLENEQYLGAIAIGGIIFGFVYWGFGFLRMSVTGLTAQAYGAKDSKESVLILKRAAIVALLIGARPYLIWIAIAPPINSVAYIWDGVFIGATASTPMRNSMLASTVVFLLAYFLLKGLGNHGLWMALTLFSIARGATLTFLAPKHIFSLSVPQKRRVK